MNYRCAQLPISDPALRCKLFDSLVLPILRYASEVWGVEEKIGDAAELLHRQFLKQILDVHVRDSTANVIVLANAVNYAVSLCVFVGGNKLCAIIIASTICLMINASACVPLLRACIIQHIFLEP